MRPKKYDVPLRNYEEISRYLPIEINLFEYFPERKRELANWFYNYHPYIYYPHTEPRYASTWTRFCDDAGQGVRQLNFFTVAQCQERDSLTVTKGLEWTPRGYRILVQVKDLHDDFIVVSKDSTPVQRRRARSSTTPTGFNSHVTRYTGTARDPFFEFLEAGGPGIGPHAVRDRPLASERSFRRMGRVRRPRNARGGAHDGQDEDRLRASVPAEGPLRRHGASL